MLYGTLILRVSARPTGIRFLYDTIIIDVNLSKLNSGSATIDIQRFSIVQTPILYGMKVDFNRSHNRCSLSLALMLPGNQRQRTVRTLYFRIVGGDNGIGSHTAAQ